MQQINKTVTKADMIISIKRSTNTFMLIRQLHHDQDYQTFEVKLCQRRNVWQSTVWLAQSACYLLNACSTLWTNKWSKIKLGRRKSVCIQITQITHIYNRWYNDICPVTHTHTHTQPFYCSSGICPGPPGWARTRKVKPGRLKPIWIYWSKR